MPISSPPRPTFLVRRTLEWMGATLPSETFVVPEVGTYLNSLIPSGEAVELWWSALEPLVLALTLAGYECPEIVVVRKDQPSEYLRLRCWEGLAPEGKPQKLTERVQESWSAAVGVDAGQLGFYGASFLRVTVRRTLDTPVRRAADTPVPPRFPPIPLEGLIASYRARPDETDPFADPADGWIDFTLTTPNPVDPLRTADQMGPPAGEARDRVVDALIDRWAVEADRPEPVDVGIVRCLDPSTWESPLDRAAWVWPFDILVGEIWTSARADGWSTLRTLLKTAVTDPAASLQELGKARTAPLWQAIDALGSRSQALNAGDESLDTLLEVLAAPPDEKTGPKDPRHWILALFVLHEYSLIRILPFALAHQPAIPFADLTGWYETSDAVAGRPVNASMQLNQAGDRLIGWLQDGQLERWDIDAQLVAPGNAQTLTYAVTYMHRGQQQEGTIDLVPRVDPDVIGVRAIVVSTSGGTTSYALWRQHRHALLPPATVLASLGGSGMSGLETQIAPLHSSVPDVIERAGDLIVAAVADLAPMGSTTGWDMAINTLESRLRDLLGDTGVLIFEVEDVDHDHNPDTPVRSVPLVQDSPMLERFRNVIAGRLCAIKITIGADGDGWTQLRRIVGTLAEEDDQLPSVYQLSYLLALDPNPHHYEFLMGELGPQFEVDLVAQLGYGAAVAPTWIIHKAECAPNGDPHGWDDLYGGFFVTGSGGVATEMKGQANFITISTLNELSTPLDWGPDDFAPSVFVIGETSPYMSIFPTLPGLPLEAGPGGSLGWEYEEYGFYGRRGWATGRGDGWVFSGGVAVSVSPTAPFGFAWTMLGLKGGVLLARVGLAQPKPPPPPPPPPPTPSTVAMTVEHTEEFAFDESGLTLPAQDDLAKIVARHRQILEWPHARIEIEGHASPPGDDVYNDRLSWERVLTVYAFVRSLLSVGPSLDWAASNALAVRDSRVELVAWGETCARYAGLTAGTVQNADWQRCKLVINGQVMVIV